MKAYDLLRTTSGHGSSVWSVAFDSNDILSSGSSDRTIKLWNKNTGDPLRILSCQFTEKNKIFRVKIILVLYGTWKLNFTMKIVIILIISHSYVY